VVVDHAPARTTIARAIASFLTEHSESSALNTQKKYRHLLRKIQEHSDTKGYVLVEQWGPIDVREFRASWAVSPLTASKKMTVVRSFFEFALVNEWIMRNPDRLVKEKRGREDLARKERLPFTDDDLKRMFEACENQYGMVPIRWSRNSHQRPAGPGETVNYRYSHTGQDLADFISVSVYTGLRISDVCTFHIERLLPTGECWVRAMKSGRKVYTWIPEWLQERVRPTGGTGRPADLRDAHHERSERGDRRLAKETEASMGSLRTLAR
jgi:integrase